MNGRMVIWRCEWKDIQTGLEVGPGGLPYIYIYNMYV